MRKTIHGAFVIVAACAFLTLAACSSSSGDGSHEPKDVTVVVPPNSQQ
jgi:predicted small secreted protein